MLGITNVRGVERLSQEYRFSSSPINVCVQTVNGRVYSVDIDIPQFGYPNIFYDGEIIWRANDFGVLSTERAGLRREASEKIREILVSPGTAQFTAKM